MILTEPQKAVLLDMSKSLTGGVIGLKGSNFRILNNLTKKGLVEKHWCDFAVIRFWGFWLNEKGYDIIGCLKDQPN